MIKMADHYNEPILFKKDVQVSYHDITLNWSDGEYVKYTFSIIPTIKNDSKTIELQTKLESTRAKPPALDMSVGL